MILEAMNLTWNGYNIEVVYDLDDDNKVIVVDIYKGIRSVVNITDELKSDIPDITTHIQQCYN